MKAGCAYRLLVGGRSHAGGMKINRQSFCVEEMKLPEAEE
jgi:hypothetical protein